MKSFVRVVATVVLSATVTGCGPGKASDAGTGSSGPDRTDCPRSCQVARELAPIPLVLPRLLGSIHLDESAATPQASPHGPADADHFSGIRQSSNLVVLPDGRVYVADAATGAVHEFDDSGHRLRVLRPVPTDPGGTPVRLQVSTGGDVFLARYLKGDEADVVGIVHFAPDGTRVAEKPVRLEHGKPGSSWRIQPRGDRRWIFENDGTQLVDAQGKILWTYKYPQTGFKLSMFEETLVASDGSLVLERGDTQHPDVPGPAESHTIVILSPDGGHVDTWKLPVQADQPLGIAFDGERLVERVFVDADRKQEAFVVTDAHGKALSRFVLPVPPAAGPGTFHLVQKPQGRELWVSSGKNAFDRYAMP